MVVGYHSNDLNKKRRRTPITPDSAKPSCQDVQGQKDLYSDTRSWCGHLPPPSWCVCVFVSIRELNNEDL